MMTALPVPNHETAKQRAARERCDAMIRHACEQIMAVGVDRFSVNEVLRRSGGSKATLVKYFGDRSGLIAAAIGFESHRAMKALELENVAALPLQEALERALGGVLRFYLTPGAIALYRAVVSAADPEGAAGFYSQGHTVVIDTIAALLRARQGGEVAEGLDCRDLADQMVHAIRAGIYEKRLIGLTPEDPQEAAITARVRTTVALFLPALAPPPVA